MTAKSDEWRPCPRGTLTGLSRQLKQRQRVRQLQKTVGTVAVLLLAVGVGVLWLPQQPTMQRPTMREPSYGGITCSEVQRVLPEVASGTLEQETLTKVEQHLAECPHCAELARRMKAGSVATNNSTPADLGSEKHLTFHRDLASLIR